MDAPELEAGSVLALHHPAREVRAPEEPHEPALDAGAVLLPALHLGRHRRRRVALAGRIHLRHRGGVDGHQLLPTVVEKAVFLWMPGVAVVVARQPTVRLPTDERHRQVPPEPRKAIAAAGCVAQPEARLHARTPRWKRDGHTEGARAAREHRRERLAHALHRALGVRQRDARGRHRALRLARRKRRRCRRRRQRASARVALRLGDLRSLARRLLLSPPGDRRLVELVAHRRAPHISVHLAVTERFASRLLKRVGLPRVLLRLGGKRRPERQEADGGQAARHETGGPRSTKGSHEQRRRGGDEAGLRGKRIERREGDGRQNARRYSPAEREPRLPKQTRVLLIAAERRSTVRRT